MTTSGSTPSVAIVPSRQARLLGAVTDIKKHGEGSYGFISQVTDAYGRIADTNGDVYIAPCDCNAPLEVGTKLEFQIVRDPVREGKFRAVNAVQVSELPAIMATDRTLAVMAARTGYHDHAKEVPAEEVRKALANRFLGNVIEEVASDACVTIEDMDAFDDLCIDYLRETFGSLQSVGIAFGSDGAGSDEGRASIASHANELRELGMAVAATELETSYELYAVTCEALADLRERFTPGPDVRLSVGMLRTFLGPVNVKIKATTAAGVQAIAERANTMIELVHMLRDNHLLKPGSILPIENFMDLFCAAPVLFVSPKERMDDTLFAQPDPYPDETVKFFCELFPNQHWAHFYQMFNRRTRSLNRYIGGDTIPPHILQAIKVARQHFDYVVIATPYHEVAGREWQDPEWQRLIDPFLLGFKKGVPCMFFLGRWSDSGIFPLLHEMVADTIAYLRANKERLNGFRNPYWHFQKGTPERVNAGNDNVLSLGPSSKLIKFAEELIAAFDQGILLDFLKGKATPQESQALATQ